MDNLINYYKTGKLNRSEFFRLAGTSILEEMVEIKKKAKKLQEIIDEPDLGEYLGIKMTEQKYKPIKGVFSPKEDNSNEL